MYSKEVIKYERVGLRFYEFVSTDGRKGDLPVPTRFQEASIDDM
jgi:hypothetical protein